MNAEVVANITVVAIAGRAIMLEGPPGSGKTSLALALIDRGAKLVGDDGVALDRRGALITASPPPHTSGKIEIRNVGIVEMPAVEAPLALILKLDPAAERFPLEIATREVLGVSLPLLGFAPGDAIQALRAEYALSQHGLRFPDPAQTA